MEQVFDYQDRKNVKARVARAKGRIISEFNHCCAYCDSKPKRLTLDHVLAESKGGMDSWRNLVPACARCNASKGSLSLNDWYTPSLSFYSQERLQRILDRCDVKIWALQPRCARGFHPAVRSP